MDIMPRMILLPTAMYFDSIIYFYMLALSVHEGEDVILLNPDTFIEMTPDKGKDSPARLNVHFFKELKSAQKLFQLQLANSMLEIIGMWVDQLSLDPILFREFNRYALEKYRLDLPIEFRGKRPELTLVLNRQT